MVKKDKARVGAQVSAGRYTQLMMCRLSTTQLTPLPLKSGGGLVFCFKTT